MNSCPQVHLAGEMYKRPKFPDAKPEYQDWLNRKEIGVDLSLIHISGKKLRGMMSWLKK